MTAASGGARPASIIARACSWMVASSSGSDELAASATPSINPPDSAGSGSGPCHRHASDIPKNRSPNVPANTCAISWRSTRAGNRVVCTKISRVHGFAYSVPPAPTSAFFTSALGNSQIVIGSLGSTPSVS